VEISGIDLHIVGKEAALTGDTQDIVKGYMGKFKIFMDQELHKVQSGQWLNNPTIKELLCLAKEEVDDSTRFRYMILDTKNGKNDFNSAKKNKLYLQPFNEICKKK
ncbi:MAG: hypothetical protein K2H85_08290, partial [Allobaculum sp.]|nr:hypothetical protein [Allobaculum sp.]